MDVINGHNRKRGKSKTRWRTVRREKIGIMWGRMARNRNAWQRIRGAYAQE